LGFGKISSNDGKNIENVLTCSMANNSPSRLDQTPNNDTIKKKATPIWPFWKLEFIFERLVNFHFLNGIYSLLTNRRFNQVQT
jgi:hypothetical protein